MSVVVNEVDVDPDDVQQTLAQRLRDRVLVARITREVKTEIVQLYHPTQRLKDTGCSIEVRVLPTNLESEVEGSNPAGR